MTDDEMKQWIDNATYMDLLKKWRFSEEGDPFLKGEVGEYYAERFKNRIKEVKQLSERRSILVAGIFLLAFWVGFWILAARLL